MIRQPEGEKTPPPHKINPPHDSKLTSHDTNPNILHVQEISCCSKNKEIIDKYVKEQVDLLKQLGDLEKKCQEIKIKKMHLPGQEEEKGHPHRQGGEDHEDPDDEDEEQEEDPPGAGPTTARDIFFQIGRAHV